MNVTFDTSNPKDVAEAAELIAGLKRVEEAKTKFTSLLVFDAQRAFIGVVKQHTFFGSFEKGNKENWYKVTCITDKQGTTCTTPEACERWLEAQYKELLNSITKQQ